MQGAAVRRKGFLRKGEKAMAQSKVRKGIAGGAGERQASVHCLPGRPVPNLTVHLVPYFLCSCPVCPADGCVLLLVSPFLRVHT